MDEDTIIIDQRTRNEKIKNFFIDNKRSLISLLIVFIIIVISFYSYQIYKDKHREQISNRYNNAIIEYKSNNSLITTKSLKEIIKDKDSTYSPLAFYFLIDNNLVNSNEEINSYFNVLINEITLDNEIKNLIIYKKGLFNSDFASENQLLDILNPLIKSKSVWKAHALYLMAEYYLAKNQKQKSKEFFDQIVGLENISSMIKKESQKRLRSEFSE